VHGTGKNVRLTFNELVAVRFAAGNQKITETLDGSIKGREGVDVVFLDDLKKSGHRIGERKNDGGERESLTLD
jgi:hypothetical protein